MSYNWVGENFKYKRFPNKIEKNFPNLSKTCPYKEPLFTTISLDSDQGILHIEGRKTSFIGPTPRELNIPNADKMSPTITEKNLKI